jgi:uncharacterized repeat protein (TIGR01451 family)
MVKRGCAVIVCALQLAALLYLGMPPPGAVADSPTYLVVIFYDNWDDLQQLAPLGLDLLDLQTDRLAAMVTPAELATLRSLGFDARILDGPTTSELAYYLVTSSPLGNPLSLLYRHGQAYPYTGEMFILKAAPAEAELLSAEGFFIQRLMGPLTWPTSPPSGAAAIPTRALTEGYNPLIQTMVSSVSQTEIYTTILNLQDEEETPGWDAGRSRYYRSPELAIERDYIHDRMQLPGLSVRYQNFSYDGWSLDNIEGTLDGWGPGSDVVYIVCAHYDSTSGNSDPTIIAPGADDNASGTAAVLEAARVLSQYRFKRTLRFVTFAAEEQGLIGSYYYVAEAQAAGTPIGGAINLDMIAWDSGDDDAMDIHAGTRSDSQALGTAFLSANTTYSISLVPEFITAGATNRSDHARFWNQGYPAILAIEDFDDFNPYYHSADDTLDKLDLPYATKFVRATVATLADLAEVLPPGVRVTHSGPGTVIPGRPTALTIQYGNPSPNPATGVVITDTLGPGLSYAGDDSGFVMTQPVSGTVMWQVGYVAPYGRSAFVVTASTETSLPAGTQLTSTVNITGAIAGDDPTDNQATWTGSVLYAKFLPIIFKDGH